MDFLYLAARIENVAETVYGLEKQPRAEPVFVLNFKLPKMEEKGEELKANPVCDGIMNVVIV